MPKAILSNDKGLVQSSGNGLRLTPKDSLGGGLHFKTAEVDLGEAGGTPSASDNTFIAYTGITLPAQSIILGCTAVVTELSNNTQLRMNVAVLAATDKVIGNGTLSETDVLTTIKADDTTDGGVLNKAFGTFSDAGVAIGTKTSVALVANAGSNQAQALTDGKVVVTVAYAGVES